MPPTEPPERYYHCRVELPNGKDAVVNDLTFSELESSIVVPWRTRRPFTVAGKLVRSQDSISAIQITHTPQPKEHYAAQHNARTHAQGIADFVTRRSLLPFSEGKDVTFTLLFDEAEADVASHPDVAILERLCRRLPQAARVLVHRTRNNKTSYQVGDEYDVQDLLHALLRGYFKYSVREDPLPKVGGSRSSRADISIEELGALVELKYVRGPADQKRLVEEFSQDLVVYAAWPHLLHLFYVIYNSADLADAEALEKLAGMHEVSGKRFRVVIVLA
jgi:hypothetical protein